MKLALFLFLSFFDFAAHAAPADAIDAAIKDNLTVAKSYGTHMNVRTLATQRVFVLRETKNLCAFQIEDTEKYSACLGKALAPFKQSVKEMCSSFKADPELSGKCLREAINGLKIDLAASCDGVRGAQAGSCKSAATAGQTEYDKLKAKYEKETAPRDRREKKSKSEDTSPESAFGARLQAISDSRLSRSSTDTHDGPYEGQK